MYNHLEDARLKALLKYEILDTPPEAEFDTIVQLASQICQVPISLVSLIDEERQWFKARVGLSVQETPRCFAFCAHAIEEERVMVVEDALADKRFTNNPLVTGNPDIRFYAGAPLVTPDGYALGTLCVIDRVPRQLTPEQQFALTTLAKQVVAQLELKRTIRQLNEVVATKNRILSIISHDIKSPLLSINMLLELFLDDKVTPEEMKQLAFQMQQAVQSTDNLLNNLTEWFISQLNYGGLRISKVNLHEFLHCKINLTSLLTTPKGNQLIREVEENLELEADENMLSFIVRNLLANANKYTQDGQIKVSAKEENELLHIIVEDTGVGISKERQQQLFDWQQHKSTFGTRQERGHGLGLLLVKEFVEKHQGTLELQSEPGVGTVVKILLPKVHCFPLKQEPLAELTRKLAS